MSGPARSRTLVFALAAPAALAVLACGTSPEREPHSGPDILLITVDTLRADYLSSYGFPVETSPAIDALAAEGVVFESAIAASSRTVPSHASIMTSRYPRGHSVGYINGSTTLRDRTTLAELFRDAGYDTAGFVGNALLRAETGLDRGFDLYDDELQTPIANREDVVERLAADTTERAIAWLAEPRERPFLLWTHYQDPHGPYTPPPEDRDRFQLPRLPNEKPLRASTRNTGKNRIPAYQVLPGLELPSQYRSRYAGEIFQTDRWIGRLIDAFDATATERGNVILFTADHGESLGETGYYFMHSLLTTPDVARVPLILRAPGLAPTRREEMAAHVDILPTLLDLAGIAVPETAEGVPLAPIARGEATLPARFVYCDVGVQLAAYRDDGFLQVENLAGAWRESGAMPIPETPRWRRFEWKSGSSWTRLPRQGELPAAILDYARTAEAMEHLPLDAERSAELRALGYLSR